MRGCEAEMLRVMKHSLIIQTDIRFEGEDQQPKRDETDLCVHLGRVETAKVVQILARFPAWDKVMARCDERCMGRVIKMNGNW